MEQSEGRGALWEEEGGDRVLAVRRRLGGGGGLQPQASPAHGTRSARWRGSLAREESVAGETSSPCWGD